MEPSATYYSTYLTYAEPLNQLSWTTGVKQQVAGGTRQDSGRADHIENPDMVVQNAKHAESRSDTEATSL